MKVPPGHYCDIKSGRLQIRRHATTFFDPLHLDDRDIEAFVAERAQVLARRARWYFERGIRLGSHLTGGKDSRTLLAVMAGSGLIDRLDQLTTVGEEDNGDVIIARQVARALGLSSLHDVRPRGKTAQAPPLSDIKRGFLHSIAKYDGQLTAYDGAQKPFQKFPDIAFFTGAGGEIYRPKSYRSYEDLPSAYAQFVNWSATHDPLAILTRPARVLQRRAIRQRVRQMLDEKITAQHTKYYIDHRLSNWGCGHWQGSAGNQIPFLLDLDLCRLMFRKTDFGEMIHYLLIKSLAPGLLQIPFFNARWSGPTRKLASDQGDDLPPLEGEVRKSFPWQFAFYRDHGADLISDLSARSLGPFRFTIDRKKLSQLRITEAPDSAQIKALFSLITGRDLAELRTLRDPDTPQTRTVFSGSLSARLASLPRGNAEGYIESVFGSTPAPT